jgi:hypothetical protein
MRTIRWATVFDSLDFTCRIARAGGQQASTKDEARGGVAANIAKLPRLLLRDGT